MNCAAHVELNRPILCSTSSFACKQLEIIHISEISQVNSNTTETIRISEISHVSSPRDVKTL